MKKILINIILICIIILSTSYNNKTKAQYSPRGYYFGFRIIPTYSGITQYLIVYAPNGIIETTTPISKNKFLSSIQGQTYSDANPNKKNILKKEGINNCNNSLNNLWRIRYSEYPFYSYSVDTLGWAKDTTKFVPSEKQMNHLRTYGINSIHDIFFGKNCFRLIKNMENKNWVENYKKENL